MARLFVGLDIHETLIEDLADARGGVEGAHWQRDNQLHLTLAFIGDAPRKTKREIEDALARIHFEPFELSLESVGMFGKPRHPKMLWAGVSSKKPLLHLHEKIASALDRVDVEIDRRKYKPHVTLARFRRSAEARVGDWLTGNQLLHTQPTLVDKFVLFSSEHTSEGSFFRHEAEFYAAGCDMLSDELSEDAPYRDWSVASVR